MAYLTSAEVCVCMNVYLHHIQNYGYPTITHCLGLGHETKVCAVCLSIVLLPIHFQIVGSLCKRDPLAFQSNNSDQ